MTPGTDLIIHHQSSIPERNKRILALSSDHSYTLEATAFGGVFTPLGFLPGEAHTLLGSSGVLGCASPRYEGPIEDDR